MSTCPDCVTCPDCGHVAYCLSEPHTVWCEHGTGTCGDCWPGTCTDCAEEAARLANEDQP